LSGSQKAAPAEEQVKHEKENMGIAYFIISVILLWSANAFATDMGNEIANISWNLFFIILSGVIGYIIGAIKSFREEKQKAYGEIIPPILKMAYNPQDSIDEKEYAKALSKLWLYGSKKVTSKMEMALKLMHDHSKGNVTRALQEAVAEMRKDIQLFSFQKLRPEDVNHLYTRIAGGEINLSKFQALKEIKSVTDNIPPPLSEKELEERLTSDQDFRRQLSYRLIRLFGLRNELMPFIEPEVVDLIDKELEPLFVIENGSYTLRPERTRELATVAHHARSLMGSIEERLLKEYRENTK
jgi:hypothetical protein